jgi:hypothetical protein
MALGLLKLPAEVSDTFLINAYLNEKSGTFVFVDSEQSVENLRNLVWTKGPENPDPGRQCLVAKFDAR